MERMLESFMGGGGGQEHQRREEHHGHHGHHGHNEERRFEEERRYEDRREDERRYEGGGGYGGGPMGGWGGYEEFRPFDEQGARAHYEQVYLAEHQHKSSLTHEVIAGAAGFAAMHAYEAHLRATGQPVTHGKMKEILAAIAAAEVDKLAETKGMDYLDRQKAKKYAEHQAHMLAEQRYGQGNTGWEHAQRNGGPRQEYNFYGGAPFGAQGCANYGWQGQGGYGGGYGGGGPEYGRGEGYRREEGYGRGEGYGREEGYRREEGYGRREGEYGRRDEGYERRGEGYERRDDGYGRREEGYGGGYNAPGYNPGYNNGY
ncbi:unnamed protein product [Mycena citricolor]|uniref:Uncharacterized protein n=1 Tax=Mycena citricolor TaxID=2018698 RepID=A0AAD2GV32_9AGAR|nr:unnamed protein product [Mycena citricolor]CAK5279018.1 unnamed protein product [Mycena citricolor]